VSAYVPWYGQLRTLVKVAGTSAGTFGLAGGSAGTAWQPGLDAHPVPAVGRAARDFFGYQSLNPSEASSPHRLAAPGTLVPFSGPVSGIVAMVAAPLYPSPRSTD